VSVVKYGLPVPDADPFQRVLQREPVHDRGQHADIVAGGAIHPAGGRREAAKDVAAPDHDPDLDAGRPGGPDLAGNERAEGRVDAVLALTEERFAGDLEQDPAVPRRRHAAGRRRGPGPGLAHSSSPSA
jgi:hypothetical protein